MGRPDLSGRLPLRDDVTEVTYCRNPTAYELKCGYGATHYRRFSVEECCHPGTRIPKKWIFADDEKVRYYRR